MFCDVFIDIFLSYYLNVFSILSAKQNNNKKSIFLINLSSYFFIINQDDYIYVYLFFIYLLSIIQRKNKFIIFMGIFDNNKRVYLRRKSLKLQTYAFTAMSFVLVGLCSYLYYERSMGVNPIHSKNVVSEVGEYFTYKKIK